MGQTSKVRIAVVGLGFGSSFAKIYKDHPDVEYVGLCEINETKLHEIGDALGIERRHTSLDEVIASDAYDAVHLLTPIPLHAQQSLAILNSGKHCACAVPMGTTLEELQAIVDASRTNQRNYMMMETAVYTYYFLMVKEMVERGEFGRIQFLRGAHYQDMENWPAYWSGLPPMHYATHAVSPLLAISKSRATKVHCFGSGYMRDELKQKHGNPYPIESAIFQLDDGLLSAEVTRTLFHTARGGLESFNVYGEETSFEWHLHNESPILFKKKEQPPGAWGLQFEPHPVSEKPDFRHLLPEQIAHHVNGGHHGSHPYLVHEFISSIVEKRNPWIDAVTSANWTAAGICAHQSAMNGGAEMIIPSFR
ncbi:Gfo/Idh/MocA family protein [Paenibacillus swuensis]|nr:Gfo/Idh/MocA family oxidoreductase [Paenibacillus swuensis]